MANKDYPIITNRRCTKLSDLLIIRLPTWRLLNPYGGRKPANGAALLLDDSVRRHAVIFMAGLSGRTSSQGLLYAIARLIRRSRFATNRIAHHIKGCRVYRRRTLNRDRRVTAAARYLVSMVMSAICALPVFAAPGDFPHWDEQACSTCHGNAAPAPIENYDDDAMCGKCHDKSGSVSCRHPSNLAIGDSPAVSLPDDFRSAIREGQLVCTTCHDPLVQCQGDHLAPYLNPRFLRGGPFQQADEACLLCHDSGAFQKLNPHEQLIGGEINNDVCRFCHQSARDGNVSVAAGFQIEISRQCLSCHAVLPHPMSMIPGSGIDSWNHLVVPGESTLRRMSDTRARTGARIPVEPNTGKVTCATCHDPHETSVIPGDPPFQEKARLRPVVRCENCHEK